MPVFERVTDLLPAHGSMPEVSLETSSEAVATALTDANTRIVPVVQGDGLELPVTALSGEGLFEALNALGATGKQGEITKVVLDGVLHIAVGLGESNGDIDVRRAMGTVARELTETTRAVVTADFGVRPVVEGLLLGGYAYNGLKTREKATAHTADGEKFAEVEGIEDTPASSPQIVVIGNDGDRQEFEEALTAANAVALARDLVNTPSNLLYPGSYAEMVEQIAPRVGLTVDILNERELSAQGFGGIVAVGQGSTHPPRLVHVAWVPEQPTTSVALVGKGITFDTGGISIKPAAGMEQMVMDMGGSAAVFAAVCAAAARGLPIRVDAWMPLAENMPSGSAQRPGDVIVHYGGITSEVLNTDAEGRLVLADAIARASEDSPAYLIETSTLTGAQMVALGKRTFGVMGSEDLRDTIANTAQSIDEPAWAMPLLEEHEEEIASKVADLRNVNSDRFGGMEFAGTYLSKFVGEGIEWAHIDVASPAWNTGGAYAFTPARATGVPVRTLIEVLASLASGMEHQVNAADE